MSATAYVRITAKATFAYSVNVMDSVSIDAETLSDTMNPGDIAIGFVDSSDISSRSKDIRILEVEDGTHQISVFPRSKVKVERLECAMNINDLISLI